MKASELTKAKYYLNTELKDDATEYGGIAHRGETLKEFICDTYELNDITKIDELEMSEVNDELISCGIQPIDCRFEKERKQFAVMIGMYYRDVCGDDQFDDSLSVITDIIKCAENHDFELINEYEEWVIDTEKAREAAYNYAYEIREGR